MNQGTSSVSVSSNGYVSVANNGLNSNNAPSFNQNLNQGGSSVTVSSNSASSVVNPNLNPNSQSTCSCASSNKQSNAPRPNSAPIIETSIYVACTGGNTGSGSISGTGSNLPIRVNCQYL